MSNKPKILFFDIETSLMEVYTHYIGRKVSLGHHQIKTQQKIICICYGWLGESKVHSLQWDAKQDDTKMLKKFNNIAKNADIVIGHNGDNFDIKIVRTRMAELGLDEPWCEPSSMDTLKDARRLFRFPSNTLDYLSKVFGRQGKDKMGFEDWVDIQKRCPKALNKMVKYCKRDVKELIMLYKRMEKYVKPTAGNAALKRLNNLHLVGLCPSCESKDLIKYGHYNYKGTISQKYLCKNCYKVIR